MRIFITGGTGFVGKYVVEKLDNNKNRLLILSRNPRYITPSKNITFIKSDLGRISQWKVELKKFRPESAIHLAWEGIPDYGPENSIRNLNHGLNLTRVLSEIGCKKILTSGSLWEYGEKKGRVSESTPVEPFNAFTAAKNSLHWLGREIAKKNNMIFIWTRLFYVYGPGQKETSLISYLIKCAKENKQPEIRNPNSKNDFIYVDDVAQAIYQILYKSTEDEVFNIGSGKLTNVQSIIRKIFSQIGIKKVYHVKAQEQMDSLSYFYADLSKIKKKTGWKPQTSIDDGIKKTIEFYRSL